MLISFNLSTKVFLSRKSFYLLKITPIRFYFGETTEIIIKIFKKKSVFIIKVSKCLIVIVFVLFMPFLIICKNICTDVFAYTYNTKVTHFLRREKLRRRRG